MAENQTIGPGDLEALGRGIGKEISGPRLPYERQYVKFLDSSRYFNKRFDPIRPEAVPGYYAQMSEDEQSDHELYIEFFNAANFKKIPPQGLPPNLETLSKNPGFAELSTSETEKLCQIPGVYKALTIMVQNFDNDSPLGIRHNGEEYSLRTAKNRKEVDNCRKEIAKSIRSFVVSEYRTKRGVSFDRVNEKDLIDLKCREAEQAAFALAYIGGVFDGGDSVWTDSGRQRAKSCFNDCVNVPMALAMCPMDWIVNTFKKSEDEVAPYPGKFGEWAYEQAVISNGGGELKIDNIYFISNEDDPKNGENFWRVVDGGKSIIVPECCPRRLIGSIFDETTVKAGGRQVPLIEFIRRGQEIPWDEVADTFWSDYGTKISKAAVISDYLQGKVPVKWGDTDFVTGWVSNIKNALSKFGLRRDDSLKRWIIYAMGINTKKRAPELQVRSSSLRIASTLGDKGLRFVSSTNMLFFPKDR